MSRKIALMAILAVTVFFSACVGLRNLGVFDESVPEAMTANLQLRNNISVILFNNQPVDWRATGLTQSRVTISLPAGEHSFMLRWTEQERMYTRAVNIDMIPGRTYRVDLQWLFFINRIRVRDVTPRNAR